MDFVVPGKAARQLVVLDVVYMVHARIVLLGTVTMFLAHLYIGFLQSSTVIKLVEMAVTNVKAVDQVLLCGATPQKSQGHVGQVVAIYCQDNNVATIVNAQIPVRVPIVVFPVPRIEVVIGKIFALDVTVLEIVTAAGVGRT